MTIGEPQRGYTRIILHLHHGARNPRLMRMAAQLARALEADLQGVFVQDAAALALADLPFARELRLPAYEWHPLEQGRLLAELDEAAALAERLLDEAAAASGIASAFRVHRGDPVAGVTSAALATDIVIVGEPPLPRERAAGAFAKLFEAAYRSAASVVLVPSRSTYRRGPIAAVVASSEDPNLEVAAGLALRAREELLLLIVGQAAAQAERIRRAAQALGVPVERVRTRVISALRPTEIARALAGLQPQLLVLERGSLGAQGEVALARIADAAGIPVLAVDGRR